MRLMSWPLIRMTPPSIVSSPLRQLSRVVLPQPDGPMMATISPRGTLRLTPRSACTVTSSEEWYVFTTSVASMIRSAPSRDAAAGCGAERVEMLMAGPPEAVRGPRRRATGFQPSKSALAAHVADVAETAAPSRRRSAKRGLDGVGDRAMPGVVRMRVGPRVEHVRQRVAMSLEGGRRIGDAHVVASCGEGPQRRREARQHARGGRL